jgi:hypothetical protein
VNEVLKKLTKSELVEIIEGLKTQLELDFNLSMEYDDGWVVVGSSPKCSATVANVAEPERKWYNVTAYRTELWRVDYHVEAISPEHAIEICQSGHDVSTDTEIYPDDTEFVDTVNESEWEANEA